MRKYLIYVVMFVLSLSFSSICNAAPGDTIVLVTDSAMSSVGGSVTANNVPKIIATIRNGASSQSVIYSNFKLKTCALNASNGNTTTLSGSITVYVKKNGLNGEILWQQTLINPGTSSGWLWGPTIELPDASLLPGETLDFIVAHDLQYKGGGISVNPTTWENYYWKCDYFITDRLVQTAVTNATNAMNAANGAKASADAANLNALQAKDNAANAMANSYYTGTYGGSSESVGNIAGYIRNTQLPNLETKMNNLQLAVTNIQNSDTMPPTVKIETVSGARATSASYIPVIIFVTDNRPGPFTYQVNGGGWLALPGNGRVNLPVTQVGINNISVEVKDASGNIGMGVILIRKL